MSDVQSNTVQEMVAERRLSIQAHLVIILGSRHILLQDMNSQENLANEPYLMGGQVPLYPAQVLKFRMGSQRNRGPVWNAFSFGIRKLSALSYRPQLEADTKKWRKRILAFGYISHISAAFPLHTAFLPLSDSKKKLFKLLGRLSLPE